MTHTLPQLPYDFSALEPHIDSKTMEIHHGKHHQGYINNLNAALEGQADLANKSISELIGNLDAVPEEVRSTVRNNGGGHYNHSLFWKVMDPKGGGQPEGDLAQAIDQDFGGFDALKEKFTIAATTRFGSGWAWLGLDANGQLVISSTKNQDNPLMKTLVSTPCTPILGLDVWEHAYYLGYQNRRPDYIAAFWNIVNWPEVARNFQAAAI